MAEQSESDINTKLGEINKNLGRVEVIVEQQDALLKQANEAGADSAKDAQNLDALENQRDEIRQKLAGLNLSLIHI